MNPSDLNQRAKAVFMSALEKESSELRLQYLDKACADEPELRREVMELLDSLKQSERLLENKPAATLEQTALYGTDSMRAGEAIGPYKLLEEIGEGGMGTVWVAQQSQPIKRKVALKLIKAGMDSKQVLARFEAERAALALMDHPNIARVLDGGMTEQGRPYFAMEYVKGVPLTEYCDQAKLSVKERLQLFLPICHAVQHAHQKGIIHRDLKPSNILVCLYDGKPVPKVIDFGLAKATHQSLTEQSLYTAHGMMLGTPLYMSPEQAEHNNLDIDTRTDVYSLGVILYELLTGSTPLEKAQFKEAAAAEILRLIKEMEFPKPSTRLSGSDSLPSVAAQRSIDPNQLTRCIAGDLDWVVMKALEKERNRRYETASAMATDIRRYLHDEPVEARPPSRSYRLRKFVRRNRIAVFATASVLTALLAGFSVATWQSIRASMAEGRALDALEISRAAESRARTLAEDESRSRTRVEQLMQSEAAARRLAEDNYLRARRAVDDYLARVADDKRLQNGFSSLRKELLDDARRYYLEFLDERVDDQQLSSEYIHASFQVAQLDGMIGSIRDSIDGYNKLIVSIESATTNDRTVNPYRAELATCYFNLGSMHLDLDEYDMADTKLERALVLRTEILDSNPADVDATLDLANCQRELARLHSASYQSEKAQTYLEPAIVLTRKLVHDAPNEPRFQSELGAQLNGLANIQMMTGDYEASAESLKEAQLHQTKAVELDPTNLTYLEFLANHSFNLGMLLGKIGQRDVAIESLLEARKDYERLVQIDPSVNDWTFRLARSLMALSDLYDENQSINERIRFLEQAETIIKNQMVVNPDWNDGLSVLGQIRHSLALVNFSEGRFDAALAYWQLAAQSLRILAENDPVNDRTHDTNLARTLRLIGNTLVELKRHEKAREAFLESEARFRRLLADDSANEEFMSNLAQILNAHALSLLAQNQLDAADDKFDQSGQLLNQLVDLNPVAMKYKVVRGGVYCNRGNVAAARDDVDEAETWYGRAIVELRDVLEKQPNEPVAAEYLFNAHLGRGEMLIDAGRYTDAIEACNEALAETDPHVALSFQLRRAWCLAKTGDNKAAVTDIEALIGRVDFDDAAMLNIAGIFCICAESLESDNGDLSKKYSARALEWLEKALASGELAPSNIKQDANFKFLWNNDEFRKLVGQ